MHMHLRMHMNTRIHTHMHMVCLRFCTCAHAYALASSHTCKIQHAFSQVQARPAFVSVSPPIPSSSARPSTSRSAQPSTSRLRARAESVADVEIDATHTSGFLLTSAAQEGGWLVAALVGVAAGRVWASRGVQPVPTPAVRSPPRPEKEPPPVSSLPAVPFPHSESTFEDGKTVTKFIWVERQGIKDGSCKLVVVRRSRGGSATWPG